MNNTTTIRALTVIVVVVLIFTAGSLVIAAAASSSSSTLQPQNLICTHSGNNATCIQEGIIPATTQIPLPTPQQQQPQPPPATLTVIKHVINDIVGTIFAKDFTSSAGSTNVSPQSSFPGTTTTVTLKPANFSGPLLQQANATIVVAADHNKCSSSDDIVNCTHNKETHHSAKDTTTPFVLPIPFP
jgi:hypothetical protein